MADQETNRGANGRRRSILDLAPLELECMNALWPLGEATVREIRQVLAEIRPRAYTTILTIMDRLAHKGIVTREKSGRAWMYRPNFSAEEARDRAIAQIVSHFFAGSAAALREHLAGGHEILPVKPLPRAEIERAPASMRRRAANTKREAEAVREAVPEATIDESLL